jgi:hypothetical protein
MGFRHGRQKWQQGQYYHLFAESQYASCKLLEARQNKSEVWSCCSLKWFDLRFENLNIASSYLSTNFVVGETCLIHFFQLQFLHHLLQSPLPFNFILISWHIQHNSITIFYHFIESYQGSHCLLSIAPQNKSYLNLSSHSQYLNAHRTVTEVIICYYDEAQRWSQSLQFCFHALHNSIIRRNQATNGQHGHC